MHPPEEQMRIIAKGADIIVQEEELRQKLERSCAEHRPLTIKLGLDPSAPDIHLGHAVVLRKIKQMQDLGHQAVIIIGDFTGRIGDPTGKAKGRSALTEAEVRENAETYCEQIFKVLDKERTQIRFNSEWLAKLQLEDVLRLAAATTVARMLERDDFKKRFNQNIPIGVHEFFYPLMQAYDSLEIQADIELGGTDQTFNILMGRTLQRQQGQEQQIALFMPLLEGLDGVEKMSKSLGNYIGVNEAPEIMFKKVMEVPDDLILKYFELATDEHPDQIAIFAEQLAKGANPRDVKLKLARTITQLYHGSEGVETGEAFYDKAFAQKSVPDQIPDIELQEEQADVLGIAGALVTLGLVPSRSQYRRLLEQGGVRLNDEKLGLDDSGRRLQTGDVLRIGKKNFVRLVRNE